MLSACKQPAGRARRDQGSLFQFSFNHHQSHRQHLSRGSLESPCGQRGPGQPIHAVPGNTGRLKRP